MKAYIRTRRCFKDDAERYTEGPYEVPEFDRLPLLWEWLKRHGLCGSKRVARSQSPRRVDGGVVFYLTGEWANLLVMPVGSELHKMHAPPSHKRKGGPLYEEPKT